jgi:hypothetical protein
MRFSIANSQQLVPNTQGDSFFLESAAILQKMCSPSQPQMGGICDISIVGVRAQIFSGEIGTMRAVFLTCEMFSAEEPCIDGPCARPDHCESGAKRRKNDAHPGIACVEENSDGQLNDGNDGSNDRSPQAYEEKYSGCRSDQMQNDMRGVRCFTDVADPTVKESDTYKKPLEKHPRAGPTVSKRRK